MAFSKANRRFAVPCPGCQFGGPSCRPNRTSSSASGAPAAVQANKWSNSMRMRASLIELSPQGRSERSPLARVDSGQVVYSVWARNGIRGDDNAAIFHETSLPRSGLNFRSRRDPVTIAKGRPAHLAFSGFRLPVLLCTSDTNPKTSEKLARF
jgi:hypothetical protein